MDAGALTKKYGPLPGSVWLLIIFVVVFILLKSRQKKGATGTGTGDTSYISGQNNKVGYTTTSNFTENLGPGAGGSFSQKDSSYYAPGPSTKIVSPPFAGFPAPDAPHRHTNYRRREDNRRQDHNDDDRHKRNKRRGNDR